MIRRVAALLLTGLFWLAAASAEDLIEVKIEGVEVALLENVRALLSLRRHANSRELDAEMVERLVQRARGEVATALRPFG